MAAHDALPEEVRREIANAPVQFSSISALEQALCLPAQMVAARLRLSGIAAIRRVLEEEYPPGHPALQDSPMSKKRR